MDILGNEHLKIAKINNRFVTVKGIGKLYYQEGFPIPMSVNKMHLLGIEVSLLHIADELLKENWKPDKVYQRLKAELEDVIAGDHKVDWDWDTLRVFIYKDYEEQREMLFNYLFETKDNGKQELRDLLSRRDFSTPL